MYLGYTIIVLCFYHSLFLAPFVAGDIKYFRVGGGLLQEGEIFLKKSTYAPHLLVTRQNAQNIVKIRSKWPEILPV